MKRATASRLLIGAVAVVGLCLYLAARDIWSEERLLYRELTAYAKHLRAGVQRSDLVTRLSPESLPILLDWLERDEWPVTWSSRLARQLNKVSPPLARKVSLQLSGDYEPPPDLAILGFEFLGRRAASAVPKLMELIREDATGRNALSALACLGEAAFAPALDLAGSPEAVVRARGVILLRTLKSHPDGSIPILLKLTEESRSECSTRGF